MFTSDFGWRSTRFFSKFTGRIFLDSNEQGSQNPSSSSVFLWTLIKFCLFSSLLAKLIRWTLKFQAKTCLESLWTLQIEYPFAFHNSPFLLWEQLLCLNAPEKTVRTIIVNETMLVLEQTTLSCWTVDAAADIPLLTFSHPLDKIRNGANKQCYEKTRRIFTACENLWFN